MPVFTTIRARVLASFSVIAFLLIVGSIGGYIGKEKNERIEEVINKAYIQKNLINSASAKSLEYVILEGQRDIRIDLEEILQKIKEITSSLLKQNEEKSVEYMHREEIILLREVVEQYNFLRNNIDQLLQIRSEEITVEDGDILILLDEIISTKNQVAPRIDEFIDGLNVQAKKARILTLRIFFGATLFTLILIPAIISFFSHGVTRPIKGMVEILKDLAEGEGDLTRRIKVQSKGEIRELSDWMNTFIQNIQEMVRQIKETMKSVSDSSQQILQSTNSVKVGSEEQSEVIGEVVSSIEEMDQMNREIAQNSSNLASHTSEASSSIMEMSASIDEVANNAKDSSEAVDESASSIKEMDSSINEISDNIDSVSSNADQTASFTEEIDRSVQEIEKNARATLDISKKSVVKAQDGASAAAQTQEGMLKIKETFEDSAVVIKRLGDQSVKIGNILKVIDEVTEQTNLLSLNAAIIAAQAGDYGKGFAVVADEIKALAERSAVASSEIFNVVRSVQKETRGAVESMEVSAESVTHGMKLSVLTKEILQQIMESVNGSKDMMEQIDLAASEQSKGSQMVKKAMGSITDSLRQIMKGTQEQRDASAQAIKNTERIKAMTNHTSHAMQEQTKGSGQVTQAIEEINFKTQEISQSSEKQAKKTQQVLNNSRKIEQIALKNTSQVQDMTKSIIEMAEKVELLEGGIDKFKV